MGIAAEERIEKEVAHEASIADAQRPHVAPMSKGFTRCAEAGWSSTGERPSVRYQTQWRDRPLAPGRAGRRGCTPGLLSYSLSA